jgi:hypothetical protein
MKLDKTSALFFGTRIDSKLREGLALSKPGDKKYFDGSSEEFLRVIEMPDEKWVGKVIRGGIPVTEVDDIQRNVLSILRRVAPNARIPASQVKIFVIQGAAVAVNTVIDEEEGEHEDALPAASNGPYISY